MARSIWKGPFVHPSLIKKVEKQKQTDSKRPIKTWSRNSTIIPEFIGQKFEIIQQKVFNLNSFVYPNMTFEAPSQYTQQIIDYMASGAVIALIVQKVKQLYVMLFCVIYKYIYIYISLHVH